MWAQDDFLEKYNEEGGNSDEESGEQGEKSAAGGSKSKRGDEEVYCRKKSLALTFLGVVSLFVLIPRPSVLNVGIVFERWNQGIPSQQAS